ncbi:MAG: GGDEF domain-containing protein [Pseudomonadota bacterium]|nr:GGDEF domain-containing protein [Pseudomonadota bacterium]
MPVPGNETTTPRGPSRHWGRHWLRDLEPEDRARLTTVQVTATRPAFTAVLLGGAAMLAVTAILQATDAAPGIGYPWWLVLLAAIAVGAMAWGNWILRDWRLRLVVMLAATATIGVFLSVPVPGSVGADHQFPIRTGLFHLIPIALLALTVRIWSVLSLIATVVALAGVRMWLFQAPPSGAAIYWLYTATTIAFGLMLSGYRTDFAVEAFRARQVLWKQAATDALTGLPNRTGWERDVTRVYEDAGRRGAPRSLVFFDVDKFKEVNDRWGHADGDKVLRSLGSALAARLGPDCYAARMGGEEFIALQIDAAPAAVERFAQRVRADFALRNSKHGCTVSAGIAFAMPGEPLADCMRRADDALYAAKEAGRDRIVIAP